MESSNQRELWLIIFDEYKEIAEKAETYFCRMMDLIGAIIDSPLSNKYYPSTSHYVLGVSQFENYTDRRENPRTFIRFDVELENFIVEFYKGLGAHEREKAYPVSALNEILNDVQSWIED